MTNIDTEYPKIESLFVRDEKTFKFCENPRIIRNEAYALVSQWVWTEKIDGTNVRVIWDPSGTGLTFKARTDRSEFPKPLFAHLLEKFATYNVHDTLHSNPLQAAFPDLEENSVVVLYGEGCGGGIRRNELELYSLTETFVLFDVAIYVPEEPLVQERHTWWLNDASVFDIAGKLGVSTPPFVFEGSIQDAATLVKTGFNSAVNLNKKAEGLVGKPRVTLYDNKGERLIVKLKTRDFARD